MIANCSFVSFEDYFARNSGLSLLCPLLLWDYGY